MALVVETGARVTGANTFINVTDADTYFSDRGMTDWTGTDAAKEAALIRAGQYLNCLNWRGYRITYRQAMCWPRYNVPIDDVGLPESYDINEGYYWPSNEIPPAILQAQCEVALRYLVGTDILPDLERGGAIVMERVDVLTTLRYLVGTDMLPDLERGGAIVMERVDVLTTQYSTGAPAGTIFQIVKALLRPFLLPAGGLEMVRG